MTKPFEEFCEDVKYNILDFISSDFSVESVNIREFDGNPSYSGLVIKCEAADSCPVMNLDKAYTIYEKNNDFDECLRLIAKQYQEKMRVSLKLDSISNYEDIKDKIRPRLINKENNLYRISELVTSDYSDLAVVYAFQGKVTGSDGSSYNTTVTVTKDILNWWGISKDRLEKDALENISNCEFRLRGILSTINEMLRANDSLFEFGNETLDEGMYVLSYKDFEEFGASVVLSDKIMDILRQRLGDNFIIIPSSTDELLIVKHPVVDDDFYERINELIDHINCSEVPKSKILSNHVYYYDYDKHELCDYAEKEVKKELSEDNSLKAADEQIVNTRPYRRSGR